MTEILLELQQEVGLVQKYKNENNMSFAQIAELMGFSETTAKRRYKASLDEISEEAPGAEETLEEFPDVIPQEIVVDGPFIPENKGPIERFAPLVRTGDCMVVMDLHIPLHDPGLINAMVACARENGLTKLIIAGDYFNMETFSSYLPYQPEAALDIERYDGALVMKTLLQTFDEIDFIWGNHDFRLTRKMGFKQSFEDCMRWMLSDLDKDEMDKIRFSDLDYMYYHPVSLTEGKKFRICHPRNFSSVPLTVGRKLAQKYQCSIITAHSHHCAIGIAPDGVNICIEGGGFFDKDRTEYIQRTTNHHEWVQGFVFFKDGLPNVISPAIGNDAPYREEVILNA